MPLNRSGLLDGPFALAASLLAFGASSDAGLSALRSGVGSGVLAALGSGREGPLLELSPSGLLCVLEALHHLAQPDCEGPAAVLGGAAAGVGGGAGPLPVLLGLLSERHTGALQAWPVSAGGGRAGVYRLVVATTDLLQLPLSMLPGACCAADWHWHQQHLGMNFQHHLL